MPLDKEKFNTCPDNNGNNSNTTTSTTLANVNNMNNNSFPIIFYSQDELDNEISASIDFSSSPTFSVPQLTTTQRDQFDFSSVQPQLTLLDMMSADGLTRYPAADSVAPLMRNSLRSVLEEDCLSSFPSYVPLNPTSPCSFLGPDMSTCMSAGTLTAALSVDSSKVFTGDVLLGSELQLQELNYQGDNSGIYYPDTIPEVFNPGDLQVLETIHM